MRITLLYLVVAFLCAYAYRDWFKSLCGLILLVAVVQHPDFPNSVGGIQGLNPWNIALVNVVIAWWISRRREGLQWDMPRGISFLLLLYLGVILVAFVRMITDREGLEAYPLGYLIGENLVNSVKWVIPGLLLFDGARTRKRVLAGIGCTLAVYLLLALQVIRWMPLESAASGEGLNRRALKILTNETGFHAVNMSMMLAGASWAILACLPLTARPMHKLGIIAAALTVALGQALTGGRMGYATWGLVGLTLCVLRWRRLLLLIPVVVGGVLVLLPGVSERTLQGFGETDATGRSFTNDYEVTSGRTLIWPYVIEKIEESPLVGYGRLAMMRTGIASRLWYELGETFPHPHNAYLECLLDNGVAGALIILPFYLSFVVGIGLRMFLTPTSRLETAVGGVSLALVLALLVAAVGSQTFYPREGAVGMWAAMALALRVYVMRPSTAPSIQWVDRRYPTLRPIAQR